MRFAVIDLGGSFIKSALAEGETLSHVFRTPFPAFLPHETHREVELAAIAREFDAHVERLLPFKPRAMFISTQMHGFVLDDRFVSWQDQRSLGGGFEEFKGRVGDARRFGNEIGPGHAATVLWSAAALPRRQSRRTPLPLPNALIGSDTADETLAHSFGAYDLHERDWDHTLIEDVAWPRVTRWNEIVGEYRGIPVYSPIGDQQAALLGANLQPGELSLNIGTGSQVSVILDELRDGDFKVRPFLDKYLATITHIPAGRVLSYLQKTINTPWPEIDKAVDKLQETDLIVELSFYRGRIDNIRESNFTAGHLFLAAYQNMAANYESAARRLFPDGDWGPLVLSGGLAHKAARLRALVAEKLNREYRLSSSEDETLSGLARLAAGTTG